MNKDTFTPIDIDAEFDDVKFDEESINRATGVIKRCENGWHEAQAIGSKENSISNIEWRMKTIERNKKIANDPKRLLKISNEFKARLQDTTWKREFDERNSKRNSKKVKTPIGEFEKVKDAALALGISTNCLRRRIKAQEEGYWLESKNQNYNNSGKNIQTPLGIFKSKVEAEAFYTRQGCRNASKNISKWLKTDPDNFFYIKK